MTKIIISILILLTLGGFFIWQRIYLPKDINAIEEKIFSVEKGQNFFQIAENLEKEGLVKNRFLFDFYVIFKGSQRKLQAGRYFLSPAMSVAEIAQKIISGDTAKTVVTIPEGHKTEQIDVLLTGAGLIKKGELVNFDIENFQLNSNFQVTKLEGFLFPDTYWFLYDTGIEEIVGKMLNNFDKKLTADLKKETERQGKTIFEIVTMASMIEKEVRTKEEKKLVSGILWKRLETGMPLQVDATIAYILNGERWTFDEMRREIAAARDIDSPYNTYKYPGLPSGPICNPGLESILAAIYPEDSDYWYYLSAPDGTTYFSKTLEEHNLARAKHLK